MSVGWYLEADGVSHTLHVAAGWTGFRMPDDVDPTSWEGILIGRIDTALLAEAMRRVLLAVGPNTTGYPVSDSIELYVGQGRLFVSAQSTASASFSVPMREPTRYSFACLISADEARRLASFPYPVLALHLAGTSDWAMTLVPMSESGIETAPIECLRRAAPGTYDLLLAAHTRAGVLVNCTDLRHSLEQLDTVNVQLVVTPRYGLQVIPHKIGTASGGFPSWQEINEVLGQLPNGPTGSPQFTVPAQFAGGPAEGTFHRRDLLISVQTLEAASDQLELKLQTQGQVSYLSVNTYSPTETPGWYLLKHVEGTR